ncbi:MAG: hypothetical protein HZB76_01510 [Chlamydiae bacterium]|nr:hypothetical protein [Chlamydiota bacterium]
MAAANSVSNLVWNTFSEFVKDKPKESILIAAILITAIAIPVLLFLGLHLAPALILAGAFGWISGLGGLTIFDAIKILKEPAAEQKKLEEISLDLINQYNDDLKKFKLESDKEVNTDQIKRLDNFIKRYRASEYLRAIYSKSTPYNNGRALDILETICNIMSFVESEIQSLQTSDTASLDKSTYQKNRIKLNQFIIEFSTLIQSIKTDPQSPLKFILKN